MKIGHILALTALFTASALQAVPDSGLVLHSTGLGQGVTGVGAKAGIKIKLGSDRVVEKSERVKLSLAAGPVATLPDPSAFDGVRRSEASFVGIEVEPGYATSMNVAGKAVATHYTQLGAAEKNEQEDDDGKQSTGDKVAWVALVAGGVMVALIGYYAARCGSGQCSD